MEKIRSFNEPQKAQLIARRISQIEVTKPAPQVVNNNQ
jgi:hypothetical protein